MLEKSKIENRLTVLDSDIQKVNKQLQELEKQKVDSIALMNALNGAKQQCLNFLEDFNDDEPNELSSDDSGDVGNNADSNIPTQKDNPVLSGLI